LIFALDCRALKGMKRYEKVKNQEQKSKSKSKSRAKIKNLLFQVV
jgi:hypothetical protein